MLMSLNTKELHEILGNTGEYWIFKDRIIMTNAG